jgi:hypothetical protein
MITEERTGSKKTVPQEEKVGDNRERMMEELRGE